MSSFLGNLKKTLGIAKDKLVNKPESSYEIFEVVFVESILGMSVSEIEIAMYSASNIESRPHVTAVTSQSAAMLAGVRTGDVITALEGDRNVRFATFNEFLSKLGRPVTIEFARKISPSYADSHHAGNQGHSSTLSSNGKSKPQTSSSRSKSSSGFISSTYKSIVGASSSSSSNQPVLTEEEKQLRRDMQQRAANDRTQAWEKKLDAKKTLKHQQKQQQKQDALTLGVQDDVSLAGPSAETLRVIEITKASEAKIAGEMGYNPFKPHMSFKGESAPDMSSHVPSLQASSQPALAPVEVSMSANRSVNTAIPSNVSGSGNGSGGGNAESGSIPVRSQIGVTPVAPGDASTFIPIQPLASTRTDATVNAEPELEEDEKMWDLVADVDDALAMLLSLGEKDQAIAQATVETVYKMLKNLNEHKLDPKLRSIRVNNKAFQSKVAAIPGGVELLLAGGFQFDESEQIGNGDLIQMAENGKESYLKHAMDAEGSRKLSYTLSRVTEILPKKS